MTEELRIIVTEQGSPQGGQPAPVPGARLPSARAGGQVPGAPTGGATAIDAALVKPPSVRGPTAPPSPSGVPGSTATGAAVFGALLLKPPSVRGPTAPPLPSQVPPSAPATSAQRRASAISAIQSVGGIGGAAAAGNIAGAASGATAALIAVVTNPIAIAAAALAGGLGVATVAITAFARSVESETQRLSGFSGPLAGAQARTEIRRELDDLRRAQRIGPELAAAERLRSKFESEMTQLGTEIKLQLLRIVDIFTPFIETAIRVLDGVGTFLENNGDAISAIVKGLVLTNLPLWFQLVLRALGVISDNTENAAEDAETDIFTQQFLNLLPNALEARGPNAPIPGVARVELGA